MGLFHSKGLTGVAGKLTADQVMQLLDDEDEEMLTTCSEVDEAMLRKLIESNFDEKASSAIGMMHNAAGTGRDAALLKAASAGNDKVVLSLVEKGATVDTATVFGDTPLLRAAAAGHAAAVRQLLNLGAVVDHKNMAGITALILAASRGHAAVVNELLSSGAFVDLATWWGDTPLISAALHGHAPVVELLLKKGAAVDAQNKHGGAAVVMAARGDHCQVIDLLLEHGASVDLRTNFGDTALLKAAAAGHELAVATLLVGGADLNHRNEWGDTALTIAASRGFDAVVERLLDAGADTKLTNKDGKTAIQLAAAKGRKKCVTLLQMADRRAMRGTEAMSFKLTYNGGRLHSELVTHLLSLPKAEASAVRSLSSLRDVWPLLNDLYGVNSMWHKMNVLDDAINDYQARVNLSKENVTEAGRKRHPLNGDDPAIVNRITQAEDDHLRALQEICRLYKRKQAVLEARADQVTEMKKLLGDAITRSQESARGDPEVLSSRSASRQSSIVNTPLPSPPIGSPVAPSAFMHSVAGPFGRAGNGNLPQQHHANQTRSVSINNQQACGATPAASYGFSPLPCTVLPIANIGQEPQENALMSHMEASGPALQEESSCIPDVPSLMPTNLKGEDMAVEVSTHAATPVTPANLQLDGTQEEPLVQTAADAEQILCVARLKLAPAMEATETAMVELFKAIHQEQSILQAMSPHLSSIVDRSLSALQQVEQNIEADRILEDARTSSKFALRYHDQLEAALKSYGRTAGNIAKSSPDRQAVAVHTGASVLQGNPSDSPTSNKGSLTGVHGSKPVEPEIHPLA